MVARYHCLMLERALGTVVSARAHAAILRANLGQDMPSGLLRPEFHFDNNRVAEGLRYIEVCRTAAAQAGAPTVAWAAFGRLTHAAQDFYSHSNYVALWMERQPRDDAPPPQAIDGLDPSLLGHARLMTARVYFLDWLCLFPALQPLFRPFLPRDAHAWLNLDSPAAGRLFPYAIEAGVQRTRSELERTLDAIRIARGPRAVQVFCDL
jgi:hypothetical protein